MNSYTKKLSILCNFIFALSNELKLCSISEHKHIQRVGESIYKITQNRCSILTYALLFRYRSMHLYLQ